MRTIYINQNELVRIRFIDNPADPKNGKVWREQIRPASMLFKVKKDCLTFFQVPPTLRLETIGGKLIRFLQ